MSIEFILLAMLGEPKTGYELKAEFDGGAKFFWSAEFGQIYPTLQALSKKGWLSSKRQPSDKGPPKKIYRRTAKGTRELHHWLRNGPVIGTERFAWIAQLIYLGELNDLDMTRQFVEDLCAKQDSLAHVLRNALAATNAKHRSDESSMSNLEFHEWLALQVGIQAIEARINWCQHAVELIEQRQIRKAGKESGSSKRRKL